MSWDGQSQTYEVLKRNTFSKTIETKCFTYKLKSAKFSNIVASLPCKFGDILYTLDNTYSMKYKSLDIDISYKKDYLDGYKLNATVYKNNEIIKFKNDIYYDLPSGIVDICETILNSLEKTYDRTCKNL